MPRLFFKLFATTLLLSLAAYGQQSLADIARQCREQKEAADAAAGTPSKVITNLDLGEGPDGVGPQTAQKAARPPARTVDDRTAQKAQADEREAQHWRGPILEQKNKIAFLESQIDQANANIRSTYGSAAVDGPFTRPLVQAQQKAAQMQLQLEDLKRRLENMQDAARRAGMQSQVYDP